MWLENKVSKFLFLNVCINSPLFQIPGCKHTCHFAFPVSPCSQSKQSETDALCSEDQLKDCHSSSRLQKISEACYRPKLNILAMASGELLYSALIGALMMKDSAPNNLLRIQKNDDYAQMEINDLDMDRLMVQLIPEQTMLAFLVR